MTQDILAGVAAVILSLLFSYAPGLNAWYAGLDETKKKLVMLGVLAVTAASIAGLSCAGLLTDLFGLEVTCDRAGFVAIARALIAAVVASQATYLISPTARAVTEAKARRDGLVDAEWE